MPIDPSGKDSIRVLNSPRPVEVRESPDGEPESVQIGRRWQRVERIDDRWTFDLWWLPQPLRRTYYRIDLDDGRRLTLFRDRWSERWYRQSA